MQRLRLRIGYAPERTSDVGELEDRITQEPGVTARRRRRRGDADARRHPEVQFQCCQVPEDGKRMSRQTMIEAAQQLPRETSSASVLYQLDGEFIEFEMQASDVELDTAWAKEFLSPPVSPPPTTCSSLSAITRGRG